MPSIGGRIVLEFIAVGGMTKLSLTTIPRETEADVTAIGGRISLELIVFGGMTEVGLTPIPIGTEGDVTPIVERIVLELTPDPRGIDLEGIAPVPKGTEGLLPGKITTQLLVLRNDGKTELEEGGIVMSGLV